MVEYPTCTARRSTLLGRYPGIGDPGIEDPLVGVPVRVLGLYDLEIRKFNFRFSRYFWATHAGAELDLLMIKDGRRVGVEVKRVDAPRLQPSMRIAMHDLKLDALYAASD